MWAQVVLFFVRAFSSNISETRSYAMLQVMASGAARDFIDGMAFHWYSGGMDRSLDGTLYYERVNKTHTVLPGSGNHIV